MTTLVALFVLFGSPYPATQPRITKLDFDDGLVFQGRQPTADGTYIESRRISKHKLLITKRPNFRTEIQKGVDDL